MIFLRIFVYETAKFAFIIVIGFECMAFQLIFGRSFMVLFVFLMQGKLAISKCHIVLVVNLMREIEIFKEMAGALVFASIYSEGF